MSRKAEWTAVVAACVAVCAILLWLQAMGNGERLSGEAKELREANAKLAEQLRAAEQKPDPSHMPAEERAGPAAPVQVEKSPPASASEAVRLELIRLLDEKQARLSAAQSGLDDLNVKLSGLEARLNEANERSQRLSASEAAIKDRLDTQTRLVAALQAELKTRSDRLLEMEVASRRIRQQGEEESKKREKLARTIAELEELSRRRDNHLTSLLRRYREASDLYRNLTLRTDNPAGVQPPAGTDLSRIQSALAMAEEDLKLIQSLNAESGRLQREIYSAKP